ncbi:complement factor H-like isoform X3 [Scomber japonicus]|uniref:complement factor H-like isoform X3 n=1 Tax=Scomber japonicus TaxID=13676 RepID=UPI00230502AF|nr:complement factor H-like isoform X3 [Scomber japonicus]
MHVITQICVLFCWMHTVTFVTSQDCTLEAFINSRKYDLNFDTTELESSYALGKQVRVGCNVGFSGFFKLICLETGWKTVGSKCQAKSCGHPGDAQFADFQLEKGDDFVFGSEVVYTCHKGYQMVSRINYRRCLSEGWDGVVPVCEAQQCPVIRVENNVQVIGDLEEGNYGNVIRFSCKIRNQILEGPSEIYCDENGQWSGTAPICKEVTCAPLKIDNGNVPNEKPVYKEHEILEFECNYKYIRSDGRPSKCTKHGTTSVWSPTPSCDEIKCKVNPLEGTRFDPPYKNLFSPGETVRVTCDDRYWVSTRQEVSAVSTCQENGEWTFRPICQEVTCPDRQPPNMDYWERRWQWSTPTLDATRRFTCRYGYKSAGGARSVKCTRDGWKPDPACQEVTCAPPKIENGNVLDEKPVYKEHEILDFACDRQYKRSDGRPSNCTKLGTTSVWSPTPSCDAIKCQLTQLEGTRFDPPYKNLFLPGERVRVTCDEKYWVSTPQEVSAVSTCQETGEWTIRPICLEVTCSDRRQPYMAYWQSGWWRSRKLGATREFVCGRGYKSAGGARSVTCTRDGWKPDPACQEVTCAPPKIENGNVLDEKPVYQEHEILEFECDRQYKRSDERPSRCIKHGTTSVWSPTPSCEPIKCMVTQLEGTSFDPPYKNLFSAGETIRVTCDEKYWVSTPQEVSAVSTCQKNGEWTIRPLCLEVTCSDRRQPNMESWESDWWWQRPTLGATRRFTCSDGYKSTGGATSVTCTRDGWKPDPACQGVTCAPPKIENGNVLDEKPVYQEHEILEFECDRQYKRSNGRPSRCTKLGITSVWSPTPSCELIKCKVSQLEGTSFDPPHKNLFSPGETIRVTCDEKYWVSTRQEVSAVSTCQETGEWTFRPICLEVKCSDRRQPNMDYWESGWWWSTPTLGDTKRFSCRYGYKSAGGATSVTCTRDGWKPDPACQEVTCAPLKIENGNVLDEKPVYQEHEILEFECDRKYKRSDGRPSKCTKQGTTSVWSPTPSCDAMKCQVHQLEGTRFDPPYKNVFSPGETVRVTCDEKYGISTRQEVSAVSTCQETGEWTFRPICLEVTCSDRRQPNMEYWDSGWRWQRPTLDATRRFRCRYGYKSTGGATSVTCTRDGWKPDPACQELLGCEPPPALDHGDIKYTIKSQYNHNERVEYMCQLYHTMEGEPNRTCIDGEWTGHMRCLEPCILNEDDTRQHNITLKLSDKKFFLHDEIMQFECAHGGPVGNMAMRQRCNSGVVLLPTCQ